MKYEFTGETKTVHGVTLHRIRALRSSAGAEAGDAGGWLEREENLSQNGSAWVYSNAEVCDNAEVFDNAKVCGNARVAGNAVISSPKHLLVVGPVGSQNDYTTFFKDADNEITVVCGCFLGKIDAFLEAVANTHGNNKYAKEYRAAAELAKIHIDLTSEKSEEENG